MATLPTASGFTPARSSGLDRGSSKVGRRDVLEAAAKGTDRRAGRLSKNDEA
jgi:hypothetical protein